MITKRRATLKDLAHVDGKAELVNGEIVIMPPTGDMPGTAAGEIAYDLKTYERQQGGGRAYADGVSFETDLPHRESFMPDASWYTGPRAGMRFLPQSPAFAVEVRSEYDYGPAAERRMRAKRDDYFATGTLVVWDVDLLSDDVIQKYTADNPETPTMFRRDQIADAEPAVPGWTFPVNNLFR